MKIKCKLYQRPALAKRSFTFQSPLPPVFLGVEALGFVGAMETLQLRLCGREQCKLISGG